MNKCSVYFFNQNKSVKKNVYRQIFVKIMNKTSAVINLKNHITFSYLYMNVVKSRTVCR